MTRVQRIRTWRRAAVCAVCSAAMVAPGALARAEPARGAEAVNVVEITPEMRAAVEKGLAYLATQQDADGSFGGSPYGRNVAITALACMAFMADGHVPGRGIYGDNVERGLQFMLNHVDESGLIAADAAHGPMYGHGFATLFLGEVYGMTGDPRARDALIKAVRLIVTTQNAQGGWRYQPVPLDADLSVTICQVMALRSARNAGLSVPKETIDKAIAYVKGSQNPDGGFRYMLQGGGSAFPRSAAGVAALYYAGIYEDAALEKGLEYLMRFSRNLDSRSGGHYWYGHYYAVQAMYLAGGEYWAEWYPLIREAMIRQQQANGQWQANHGEIYGTAMSLIVLQIPNRLLPIFQR